MGLFSGMTSGLYRQTVDGRRIYQLRSLAPPSRWPAYLVTDADAGRLESRLRRVFILFFVALIPIVSIASGGPPDDLSGERWTLLYWIVIVAGVPAIAMHAAIRLWVLRGIPRVVLTPSELQPIDRRAREMIQIEAMGGPALIGLIVAGALMTAGQLWVLIEDGEWWAWLGTALLGGSTLYMMRQLFLLRRMRKG